MIHYLWGESAKILILEIAETVDDAAAHFVPVGGASGAETINLPGAALRSSGLVLMGSGVGSVSREALVVTI